MKRNSGIILAILAVALLIPLNSSCSRFGKSKGQSTEFATFIKAHTGGIISDRSTIRVELASDIPGAMPGADIKDGILTFTPHIKGTTRWLTSNTIEFIPESGALKSGQSYVGKLQLDKIQKVGARKFRQFQFSFLVAIKEAVLSLDDISIQASSPDKANVSGTISLTEELPVEQVREMMEYSYPGNSAELSVTAGQDQLLYHFDILNLDRSDKDNTLKVWMKAGNTGFVTDSKLEVTIPSTKGFRVMDAERVEADDPYINIYFSNPLADMDDYSGLFTLEGVGKYFLQVEGARVKVFYELPGDDFVTLKISDAVKGYNGVRLAEDYSKSFSPAEEKPAVEIPLTGTILPNSKELILPFKAVNLKAVDISIVQIYEDNVLMFLQDNDLDGNNSLRRSGRLVYRRSIRLDSDPSKNLHKWQDYSVDLSGLFKQEAGAIYRVRLSFKQDYSVYGKAASFKSGTPADELVNISSVELTEDDYKEWDRPDPYFYEGYYHDWTKYVWEDRDNPLKPSFYMEESRFPSINLLTSNLGVIAKYSGGDKLWVSVSDILTAEPVFNSELYVYSYQLEEIGYAKSGTDGMAEINLSGRPFVVVAKRGGATSYLKVTDGDEKSLSRFDVGGKTLEKGLKAFIYGERGVWRPGDTLHVTLLLEDKDDRIPDKHPAVMELYTPESRYYTKIINGNGKDGFYVFDIPTKDEDPTGDWTAYFKIGGATFRKNLKIESIKPNRLKVNLDMEGTIEGGKSFPLGISSNWLTGPAASGLAVKVDMTLRSGASTFKGYEGFKFTTPLSEFSRSEHNLVDTRLDKDGKARVNVEMPPAEDAPGMLAADIVTSVQEPGGDISFNTMTVPYSPYQTYVGVKVPTEGDSQFLETDKDYRIEVVAVDKEGKPVTGENLSYAVYKIKWSWWWESRNESLDSYVNSSSTEPLSTGELTSGKNPSTIPFRVDYPDWGRYLVIVKDNESGHLSGDIFYVDWPAYRGRSAKTDPDGLTMLSFSTDKDSYEVGEKVKVFIPAASKGQALVSLENSREVISREWVKVSGEEDMTYTFKVTEQMAPNFYIHISLLQPHERADNDLPIRLYGVRPISVNDKESHLVPLIDMPDVLSPEQEFRVKIKEKNGKPMTYTLAIVDEGLLDITGFKTPDPWKFMYEREALGVKTWDLYDYVIGAYSGRFSPLFSIGGDEDVIVGAKKDNRFNPVVQFMGPFTLATGSATHKIRLPMYVGSVRVMVVAAHDAVYGNADKTVPVRSPLMVLPTLPRVIGTGEKVTLPVNVFALEGSVKSADVSVKVEGPLSVTGEKKVSLAFQEPGDKLVNFALEAVGEGIAKVTVLAEGSGQKASQTISIQVRNPIPPTVEVTRIAVGKGETRHLGYSPFESGDNRWATLELSSFPSMNYEGVFTFMKNYGFNCSEQIAARGISLLSIMDMLPEEKKKEADKMIPELLQQLFLRQLGDGGFGYWPGASDADNWVSSMAGQFMVMASQNGFSVSKGVLASWTRYQKKNIQSYRNNDGGNLKDLEQAYRLYTLALKGEPENGAMNRLKEGGNLSRQATWMLASAYSVSGKKNIAKEMLSNLKYDISENEGHVRTYGSPDRDKAIALEACALADLIPEALDLAQEVSKAMAGEWYSTQEAAFITKAMNTLSSKVNTGILSAEVTQGSNVMQVNTTKSVNNVNLDSRTGGVDIKNTSDGVIYATLVTSSVPERGTRTEARSNGLTLNVSYVSDKGENINPADILQGTDFTVTITVGNISGIKDYAHLALTESIPSGWEIFNDRLLSGESAGAIYDYRDIRDDRVTWHFDLPKGTAKTFKVKMRAAYSGEFSLPPVKCVAMYDSRISANTASGTAIVSE